MERGLCACLLPCGRWDELDEHRSGGIAPVKLHLFVQVGVG